MTAQAEYNAVSEDDSSTLMAKEEHYPFEDAHRSKSRRRLPSTSTVLLLTIFILLANIVVLSIVAFRLHSSTQQCRGSKVFHGPLGKSLGWQSVSHEYDSIWEDTEGVSGVIEMPHPDFDGEMMPASISMIHQLHCLAWFRRAIQEGHDGIDPGLDHTDNKHWPHCLDYMRKTILCWADNTIERQPRLENGSLAGFIDGITDIRTCGDSNKLIQQMAEGGKPVNTKPLPFQSPDR